MTEKLKNRNFPNLRFPGFLGEWEARKLGELLEFKNGINASKEQYGKGVKFINVLDILNNDYITYDNIVGKVDVDSTIINKFSVQFGDILFQRSSETREEVGTANVYLDKDKKATFGGFVIRGRKIGDYNPIFFNKLLKTNSARDSISSKSGGSTRFNVGQEILSSITLCFPSLAEQNKIADFLSHIDSRIQTQKKIIEDLTVLKNNVVKKLFENKLKFKNGDEDFQKWEKKRLTEISKEHLNKNPDNLYSEVFSVSKHKGVINQIEHLGRSFSAKDIAHYKVVFPGDLVYTKSPTSEFPFGIIKQNRTGRTGVVSPLYCVFTPETFELGYLLHEYFNSSVNTYNYLNPLVQKGAKNTMNINNETFLNGAKLLLPLDKIEQKHIYTALSLLADKIDVEERILLKYENQKKYLLANLFI
ncbi:restriction endonuclease subunit S [Chryseobacterium koreense]|uniref:restriction endonuclease subunit S n=1 Tax=Chryseobacterium koreense TaxID=232216 RepID=UPI0026EDAF9E|nr:restriction endonuclease subunit S [Chryseobacterium koreense]